MGIDGPHPCMSSAQIDPQMVNSWSAAFGPADLKIIKQPLMIIVFVWSLNSNMCLIHSLPRMRNFHPNEHLYPRNGQIGQLRHVSECLSIQIWVQLGVQLYVQLVGHVSTANFCFQMMSWPIQNWGLPQKKGATHAVKNGQQRLLKERWWSFTAPFWPLKCQYLATCAPPIQRSSTSLTRMWPR